MNEIPRGWAVIPKSTWYVAAGVTLLIVLLMQAIPFAKSPDSPEMPLWTWVMLRVVVPLIVALSIILFGWIYGDAKRRGMRADLWVLLAIFIPNLIGVILYFVLRDPLPVLCPQCSTSMAHSYAYCPSCGARVMSGCKQCGKTVEPGWKNCAHCGTKL